jgi:hypothetical protein
MQTRSTEAMMKKVWRTVQPPHESPNITLEQAREAFRQVRAEEEERRKRRRKKAKQSTDAPREA